MHNLCLPVGSVICIVVIPDSATGAGIFATKRLTVCIHDSQGRDLSKILVRSRNSRKQASAGLVRGSTARSVGKAEEKRGDVAYLVATAVQSFPCQGNTNTVEALMNPPGPDSALEIIITPYFAVHTNDTVVHGIMKPTAVEQSHKAGYLVVL